MPESYGHLLKTQANQVLETIKKLEIDPADSTWELESELTLGHIASGYYLCFGLVDYGQHQAYFCPGEDTAQEECRGGSWEGRLALVAGWIANVNARFRRLTFGVLPPNKPHSPGGIR